MQFFGGSTYIQGQPTVALLESRKVIRSKLRAKSGDLGIVVSQELRTGIDQTTLLETKHHCRWSIEVHYRESFKSVYRGCVISPDLDMPIEVGISGAIGVRTGDRVEQAWRCRQGVDLINAFGTRTRPIDLQSDYRLP